MNTYVPGVVKNSNTAVKSMRKTANSNALFAVKNAPGSFFVLSVPLEHPLQARLTLLQSQPEAPETEAVVLRILRNNSFAGHFH